MNIEYLQTSHLPSLAGIVVTIKEGMLPVRVEGEAQGVAAPQHQLADLVDVDVDVFVDVDVDVDLVDVGVKVNQRDYWL